MIIDKTDNVLQKFFQSLLSRYQIRLQAPMKGTNFIPDCVNLLYYKWRNINFERVESYKDSPDWIKNKRASQWKTINPLNKKDKTVDSR